MAAGGEGKDAVRSGGRDYLVAVVADEETVAGFLLAGIGHRDAKGATYMVVGAATKPSDVAAKFAELVARGDVGIILMNQRTAEGIRHVLSRHHLPLPMVLEIPDRDNPYDPSKDPVMKRVHQLLRSRGS